MQGISATTVLIPSHIWGILSSRNKEFQYDGIPIWRHRCRLQHSLNWIFLSLQNLGNTNSSFSFRKRRLALDALAIAARRNSKLVSERLRFLAVLVHLLMLMCCSILGNCKLFNVVCSAADLLVKATSYHLYSQLLLTVFACCADRHIAVLILPFCCLNLAFYSSCSRQGLSGRHWSQWQTRSIPLSIPNLFITSMCIGLSLIWRNAVVAGAAASEVQHLDRGQDVQRQ